MMTHHRRRATDQTRDADAAGELTAEVAKLRADLARVTAERNSARDVSAALESQVAGLQRWLEHEIEISSEFDEFARLYILQATVEWLDDQPHRDTATEETP